MKKCLLLVVLLLFYSTGFSQDACSKAYSEALQSFGKGNYEDAQRKFLAVAQTCTNYTDIWKYLSECNRKIADIQKQQASQISSLKNENQQLLEEKKKADTRCENNTRNAAMQIMRAENMVNLKSDTIQMQRRWNMIWRDSVKNINRRLDSIQVLLDSAYARIEILQTKQIGQKKPVWRWDNKQQEKEETVKPMVADTLITETTQKNNIQ